MSQTCSMSSPNGDARGRHSVWCALIGWTSRPRTGRSRSTPGRSMRRRARIPSGTASCFDFGNGGGGIRTHDDPEAIPVFKTGAFNRSATPPGVRTWYLQNENTAPEGNRSRASLICECRFSVVDVDLEHNPPEPEGQVPLVREGYRRGTRRLLTCRPNRQRTDHFG